MAPTTYEVFKELEREERFAPQTGTTQESSYSTLRERAIARNLCRGIAIIIGCWLVYFLYLNRLYAASLAQGFKDNKDGVSSSDYDATAVAAVSAQSNRVALEAHIMSKCPDAQDCLQKLVVPAMEQISDKVDFELSFIGSVSKKTSDVECMHGPTECIGNMLMLCAANLPFHSSNSASSSLASPAPRTPVIRSLGFANCLISDYEHIPSRSLVESCSLEHGIDFESLNQCASHEDDNLDDPQDPIPDDPSGIALLRKSIQHSEDVGVKTSCTVRVDEKVWCVRDGGEWKDCYNGSGVSTLVEEVERLWQQKN